MFSNLFMILDTNCGGITGIPDVIPNLTHLVILIIKIGVPVLLIIMGMIDLGGAVVKQKDEEIKKAQGLFFQRVGAALMVFLVVSIVQLVFNILANASGDNSSYNDCVACFINGTINGTNTQCGYPAKSE